MRIVVYVEMIRESPVNKESGFVLISILLVIAVLAVIIVEFNYESRLKLHLSDNFRYAAQALNYAEAGLATAEATLKQNDGLLCDERLSGLFSGEVQIPIENGYYTILITDESGKLNINTLKAPKSRFERQRIEQMLKLIDLLNHQYKDDSPISYSLIPAIIDWIDNDDEITLLPFVKRENEGAENAHYQNLLNPYSCKNAQFDVLSELLLVRGMDTDIFQGRAGDKNKGIKPVDGIRQFLTVYGDGKINVNEASPIVIQTLSDEMNFGLTKNIVAQRKCKRYASIAQLQNVFGMTPQAYRSIRELITVAPQSRYYKVTVTGVARRFVRKVQVVLRKDSNSAQLETILRKEL